jgi:hypothetical protein
MHEVWAKQENELTSNKIPQPAKVVKPCLKASEHDQAMLI